jgi:hypothetical protein
MIRSHCGKRKIDVAVGHGDAGYFVGEHLPHRWVIDQRHGLRQIRELYNLYHFSLLHITLRRFGAGEANRLDRRSELRHCGVVRSSTARATTLRARISFFVSVWPGLVPGLFCVSYRFFNNSLGE